MTVENQSAPVSAEDTSLDAMRATVAEAAAEVESGDDEKSKAKAAEPKPASDDSAEVADKKDAGDEAKAADGEEDKASDETGEKPDDEGDESGDKPGKPSTYQRMKAKVERAQAALAEVEKKKMKAEAELAEWQEEAPHWIAMRDAYEERIAALESRLGQHGEAPDERDARIAELEARVRQREIDEQAAKRRAEREQQLARQAQVEAAKRQIVDEVHEAADSLGLSPKELMAEYGARLQLLPRGSKPPPVLEVARRIVAVRDFEANRQRVTARLASEPEPAPQTIRAGGAGTRITPSSTLASMKATLRALE